MRLLLLCSFDWLGKARASEPWWRRRQRRSHDASGRAREERRCRERARRRDSLRGVRRGGAYTGAGTTLRLGRGMLLGRGTRLRPGRSPDAGAGTGRRRGAWQGRVARQIPPRRLHTRRSGVSTPSPGGRSPDGPSARRRRLGNGVGASLASSAPF